MRGSHASRLMPHAWYLAELTVRDFAIIEHLRVELSPGLSVLTGETGAGKSIVIDALGAALGERFESGWIRSGAERGSAEAVFAGGELTSSGEAPEDDAAPDVRQVLAALGCDADDGGLIFTRDMSPSRSICRINGRAVPVAAVARVGDLLVDVHSQANHLSLSRSAEHRDLLDRFGRHEALRDHMAEAARALLGVRRQLQNLEEAVRQGTREAVLLRHEMDEIDAAQIEVGEDEMLAARRSKLRNALRLRSAAEAASAALQGSDEAHGALALLGEAQIRLQEMRSLDPGLPDNIDFGGDVVDALEDLARALRGYTHSLEEDPSALESIEERIQLLADLKRRYGRLPKAGAGRSALGASDVDPGAVGPADGSLEAVLAYRAQAAARLDALEHHEGRTEDLRRQEGLCEAAAADAARALSEARRRAAKALEAAVASEVADVGMGGARFTVEMRTQVDGGGLLSWEVEGVDRAVPGPDGVGVRRIAFDETGVDRMTFLISANPGEPLRPVAQVASGGELARLMLALKSAMVAVDQTPVLVFDELEQGVGGRMGHVIGEKLWRLAREHQVLCVTHLPQVAAFADAHYIVTKEARNGRMTTQVERLGPEARLEELAQMLGGAAAGSTARRSAQELVVQAQAWKQQQRGDE